MLDLSKRMFDLFSVSVISFLLIACSGGGGGGSGAGSSTGGGDGDGGSGNGAPAGLSYSLGAASLTKGVPLSSMTPTNTGGAITSCSSSPTLPSGLSLSSTSCALTGTPTSTSETTSYTITATNSSGSAATSILLVIFDAADFPAMSVSAQSAASSQVALSWEAPVTPGGHNPTSYRIYRSTSSGFTPTSGNMITEVSAPSLSYTDTTVTNGTKYYYKIVATYAGGALASPTPEIAALPIAPAAAADSMNVFVTPTGNDATGDGSLSASYLTLSKAISEVSSGGTIYVADGTYSLSSNLTVNKSVTIQSYTGDYRTSAVVLEEDNAGTILRMNISASDVAILGIEAQNIGISISTGQSDIRFENNYFRDLKDTWLNYFNSGISGFVIRGNYFKNIGDRSGSGGYSQTASVMNYWPGSNQTNLDNYFTYNRFETIAWSGMQVVGATGITMAHNAFTDTCDNGIQFNMGTSLVGTNTIAYNTFSGIVKAGGHASCTGTGLLFYNSADYHASFILKLINNSFSGSDKAIDFATGNCDFTTASANIKIQGNNISATNGVGLDVSSCAGDLNVSLNYWGASSGPSGNGSTGTGASIVTTGATGVVTHTPASTGEF